MFVRFSLDIPVGVAKNASHTDRQRIMKNVETFSKACGLQFRMLSKFHSFQALDVHTDVQTNGHGPIDATRDPGQEYIHTYTL